MSKQSQIKEKMNSLIVELDAHLCTFIKDPRINEIQNEMALLQEICDHEFEKGKCKWCYMDQGGK